MKFFPMRNKVGKVETNHVTPGVDQGVVIKFVKNKETVEKAAEGSMDKRIELLRKVELHKSV